MDGPGTIECLKRDVPRTPNDAGHRTHTMEALGRLAGGVAHDLNNILTAIFGYGQLAMSRLDKGHPARADIDEIRKAGERASALARQLMSFGRNQPLHPSVIDLNAILVRMDDPLRRAIGEGIDLHVVTSPALRRIKADPGQLEQMILNLAQYARHVMPLGGRLAIETSNVLLEESPTRGAYVQLRVSDTGEGMDELALSHVFEPFFTASGTGKGAGLTLSTVFGIVRQSGGIIDVSSKVGRGSCITIHWRATEEE